MAQWRGRNGRNRMKGYHEVSTTCTYTRPCWYIASVELRIMNDDAKECKKFNEMMAHHNIQILLVKLWETPNCFAVATLD